jgi:hypothetical protein
VERNDGRWLNPERGEQFVRGDRSVGCRGSIGGFRDRLAAILPLQPSIESITTYGFVAIESITTSGVVAIESITTSGVVAIESITTSGVVAIESIIAYGYVAIGSIINYGYVAIGPTTFDKRPFTSGSACRHGDSDD